MREEPSVKLTDFDQITGDRHLQMVKAALPYITIPEQKVLSILVRLQELRKTISLFDDGETAAVGICSLEDSDPRSPLDMMNAIKPYADPQEQDFIDMVCNFLQGWRIGTQYQELYPQEIPRRPLEPQKKPSLEQLKDFLSPEQQTRLETASLLIQAMRQMA